MEEIQEFNPLTFEKKLAQLKDTQESIQGLSSWCLKQKQHHKKIVASWLNVLKRVKVEQRLVLFYLANDVIQYSKRKNYDFVESWGLNLQKATPLVRDEKVRPKILRIFKIWEQRAVYDDEFLSDLTGLLSAGAAKKTDEDALDFQPQQLVNKIRQCTVLESDTDLRLKYIHESHLDLSDADALCVNLKDRSNKDDVEKELHEGIQCVERYTQALQREIVAREALLVLLTSANQYYATQRGEVKVVAYAYKNFGNRVRTLKRKLDELIPTLPGAAPSPPQRDEDVPSPGPDEDLDLPTNNDVDDVSYNIDKTFSTSLSADGSLYNVGLSSFLGSDNPMALFNDNSQGDNNINNKIEVINNRPNDNRQQDFDINHFLKTLLPATDNNTIAADNISVASGTLSQKSQDALPGLDLLTPDSTGNPAPPTSFYGSTIEHEEAEPYQPEAYQPEPYRPEPISVPNNTQWNSNNPATWSLPPVGVPPPIPPPTTAPPRVSHCSPPASPPPAPLFSAPPPPPIFAPEMPPLMDVDHRGLLPPPPPPPVIPSLGQLEDVDHRLLPPLSHPPPPTTPNRHMNANKGNPRMQDVDHRNLIPLTSQAEPPSQMNRGLDQDYRVPPVPAPTDIVESVDMDLSEDEDQGSHEGMYSNQPNEKNRRSSSNQNNKVLVGGDNGKTNHGSNHPNLIRINSEPSRDSPYQDIMEAPISAPIMVPPLSNPFDKMPSGLKAPLIDPFEMPSALKNNPFEVPSNFNMPKLDEEENSGDSAYEEDLRARGLEMPPPLRDPRNSSPMNEYGDQWNQEVDWTGQSQNVHSGPQDPRFLVGSQRFPRNWSPGMRPNFAPPGFQPQFWPRNNPRPQHRPWMGQRPQRFW